MKFLLHTKEQTFLTELTEDSPEGVTIIDGGERRLYLDDINATVDISFSIEVIIDVAKIAPYIVIAWVAKKASSRIRNSYINIKIDGKEFSINNPKTIELVKEKINNKQ
ncbi:hypothetical protein [Nitrosomonas sp. sh817]|uniref:hypothetical protein n=1 Tax=Nitrosomonas sp. sh817 TaxID=3070658 RepID=UPI0027DAE524|nr:hypothetical protein [Nitrosomonas sp. sh817]WMJ09672.1 hypothetical protein RBH92_05620 [Nitrosomonas sp. sh817]